VLVALVDRVPPDDRILWNGPLGRAVESLPYKRELVKLRKTNSKIARAIQLYRDAAS
jgi:hypothetical protein